MTGILDVEMSAIFQRALFSAVTATSVNTYPFPFLYGRVDDPALKDVFVAMRSQFPILTELDPKSPKGNSEEFRSLVHLPNISDQGLARKWESVFSKSFSQSFSSLLVEKFITFIPRYSRFNLMGRIRTSTSKDLKSRFPSLKENEKIALINMPKDCDWVFTCDSGNYALPPHTDHPRKMVTFLLYLTEAGSNMPPPGTSLYVPLSNAVRAWDSYRVGRSQFAEVVRAKHVEGHFVAFVKSDISWHGVEPSITSEKMRMTINLTVQRPAMLGGVDDN